MIVPVPHKWTAGDRVTADRLNEIGEMFEFLQNPPSVSLYKALGQNIASGLANGETLIWEGATWDTDGMWDADNNTEAIVRTPGWYSVIYRVGFSSAADYQIWLRLDINNEPPSDHTHMSYTVSRSGLSSLTASKVHIDERYFDAGDRVSVFAAQDSGSDRTLQATSASACRLELHWVSR